MCGYARSVCAYGVCGVNVYACVRVSMACVRMCASVRACANVRKCVQVRKCECEVSARMVSEVNMSVNARIRG